MVFWAYEGLDKIFQGRFLHYTPVSKVLDTEMLSVRKCFRVVWFKIIQKVPSIFHAPLLARLSHDFNFAYPHVLATQWGSYQLKDDLSSILNRYGTNTGKLWE